MQAVNREGAGALSFLKIRSGKLFSGHSPFASLSKIYSADRDYLSHFSPRQGEEVSGAPTGAPHGQSFSPHVNHTATGRQSENAVLSVVCYGLFVGRFLALDIYVDLSILFNSN